MTVSMDHISHSESEEEEENTGSSLTARNSGEWFSRVSKNPEGLVSGWAKGLDNFFLRNPCEVGPLSLGGEMSQTCLTSLMNLDFHPYRTQNRLPFRCSVS